MVPELIMAENRDPFRLTCLRKSRIGGGRGEREKKRPQLVKPRQSIFAHRTIYMYIHTYVHEGTIDRKNGDSSYISSTTTSLANLYFYATVFYQSVKVVENFQFCALKIWSPVG
jgi:hypothetical protein